MEVLKLAKEQIASLRWSLTKSLNRNFVQFSNFVLFRNQSHSKDSLTELYVNIYFFSVFKTLLLWSIFFSTAEKWCGWNSFNMRKKINKLRRWTDKWDEEMITFTIAKQFKQLTLACKSKKNKILIFFCPYRKFLKTNTNQLIDAKIEWFFLA